MAVEPEDDELLLENQQDEGGDADDQQENQEGQGSDKPGDEGEEELEVTFGDGAAPASAESETPLVKHLRNVAREQAKRIAEMERAKPVPQVEDPGPEPDYDRDGVKYDWDHDAWFEDWKAWSQRTEEARKAETDLQRSQREANEDFARDRQAFETARPTLKVAGREDAIAAVEAGLDSIQQAVLTKAGKDAALLEQGIGRNPVLLAELASIKDPIKLAMRLGELKGKIQMTTRRKAPDPEEIASGSASVTHGKDKTLERLEAEAARNGGDRTKIAAYKREQKRAKA